MRRVWLPIVCLLAVPAAGAPGKVVRVAAPRTQQLKVDGGKFLFGVDEATAGAAASQCDAFYSAEGVRASEFCLEYAENLSHMGVRDVYVDAFYIDRDEVTVTDYRQCVAAGACDLDPLIAGDDRYIQSAWPLVNVTWDEAQNFCKWRGGGRLPTEAEWELAARGVDPSANWPWGGLDQPRDFNHGQARAPALRKSERSQAPIPVHLLGDPDGSDAHDYLAAPGSYAWGESPYGVRDMAGNVAEWTADEYVRTDTQMGYDGLGTVNPYRPPSTVKSPRVVRGGSWRQPSFFARSNLRDPFNRIYMNDQRFTHVGFRCAKSLGR